MSQITSRFSSIQAKMRLANGRRLPMKALAYLPKLHDEKVGTPGTVTPGLPSIQ
jgi:hypothetical protein